MADYYTKVSALFPMTEEQFSWLRDLHHLMLDSFDGFGKEESEKKTEVGEAHAEAYAALVAADFGAGGLEDVSYEDGSEPGTKAALICGDSVNVEYLASMLQQLLVKFDDDRCMGFEWTNDCSRARADAYGGGACAITRHEIEFFNTTSWLLEKKETLALRNKARAIAAAHKFPEGALDEAVIEAITRDASNINNDGTMEQVAALLADGWSDEEIVGLAQEAE